MLNKIILSLPTKDITHKNNNNKRKLLLAKATTQAEVIMAST